jgi:hypothetical protein
VGLLLYVCWPLAAWERLVSHFALPPDNPQPERPDRNGTTNGNGPGPSAMVMLLVAVLVVGGGYFLSAKLREMSRIQDCVMSGRTNCAPIDTSQH